jgi:ATP-dependent DNA ligase
MGLEGIVSKRAGSPYHSGPSRAWMKTKNTKFERT